MDLHAPIISSTTRIWIIILIFIILILFTFFPPIIFGEELEPPGLCSNIKIETMPSELELLELKLLELERLDDLQLKLELLQILELELLEYMGIQLQACKIEWFGGVTFKNYIDLLLHLRSDLEWYFAYDTSCNATSVLCIYLLLPTRNSPCQTKWEFATFRDIPITNLVDECGNKVIQYTNE
jgi:hypothetical protein